MTISPNPIYGNEGTTDRPVRSGNKIKIEEAFIYRLTVLYPSGEGKHFDVDYYRDKHMPMVEGFIGEDVIRSEISWGTAGLNGAEAPYMCIGQIYMKTMAGLNSAFSNHMDDMVNDIPKN